MSGTPLLNSIQETILELDPSAKAALTVGTATMAGYTIYKNVSGPDVSPLFFFFPSYFAPHKKYRPHLDHHHFIPFPRQILTLH